jgi:DNA-binding transcriptional ArsR family regulator
MRARDIEAEELLGSRGRIRVLRVIAESGELNISEVARRAGMNYTSVDRHLTKLREMGLLREKRYGKIRIFEAIFNTVTVSFERGGGVTVDLEVQKEP